MGESPPSRRRPYSAIAGHPALDLINTVSWRLSSDRRIDHLDDYDDVLAWAGQFGFVDDTARQTLTALADADPASADRELRRVRDLREQLYRAALPTDGHPAAADAAAAAVAAQYTEAIASARLEPAPRGWQFDVDLALPRRRLALAAVDVLTGTPSDAVRQCADEECGWVFIDGSPRRNRRWCVAADCGNRNRVRRHTERARAAAAAAAEQSEPGR